MVKKSGNLPLIRFFLLMGLVSSILVPQEAAWAEDKPSTTKAKPVRWQPPTDVGSSGRRTGNPPQTVHGGSRDVCLNNGQLPLTALIPASYEGRVGVESPVIYVYFPYETAPSYPVSFSLKTMVDGKEQVLFESRFKVKGEAGLLAVPLPDQLALERGLVYRWRFAVQCEGSATDYVEGNLSIEPQSISPELLAKLLVATPLERAEIYMRQGWWYDAVKQLQGFRENNLTNEMAKMLWSEVLITEGIVDLVSVEQQSGL